MPNKKIQLLEKLHKAKQAHINWLYHVKLMVYGLDIDKENLLLSSAKSDFGTWFYGDAQQLKKLPSLDLSYMLNVEASYLKLHSIYFNIYETYPKNQHGGILKKILGLESNEKEFKIAQDLFKVLEKASRELSHHLLRLEKHLLNISRDEIEQNCASIDKKQLHFH